MDQKHIYI